MKKSINIIKEFYNEMKKSINMIKYDRNDNSRKRTISELIDYNKGNLNKAPRLKKRIYIKNKIK